MGYRRCGEQHYINLNRLDDWTGAFDASESREYPRHDIIRFENK